MNKVDIKSLTKEELTSLLIERGEKRFRADQLYSWMHVKLARDVDEMVNIPKSIKEFIRNECCYTSLEIEDMQVSAIDGTRKFLFSLGDGNVIEAVWMKYREWNSVCISSQVGCRMGCRFCASTLDGCVRDLKASEMLDEVYALQRATGERVSNIVVMGSGEPLDNYVNLIRFIRLISDENGLNIGERHITVSTCGIVPGIRELAKEKLQITLALSLHAPDDEKRQKIMPIAKKYSLKEIMSAVRYYFDTTGRRVTFEYALSEGVNDSDGDAEKLSALIKGTC